MFVSHKHSIDHYLIFNDLSPRVSMTQKYNLHKLHTTTTFLFKLLFLFMDWKMQVVSCEEC